jgi:tyrosinase
VEQRSGLPGQVFAAVHGAWCLHYQEAFLFWHRAYLMRFEQEIGCAVPYWNWYAQDAAIDGSPSSGLPQAFKDETYIHPRTGERRPNPLRHAAARNGRSKLCEGDTPPSPSVMCNFVQRDPTLYTSGDDRRAERERKIGMVLLFQQQVRRALAFGAFSHPQGAGHPWANIQTFDPPPPDTDYVYRNYDFDGAYEQPHDNFHGWVGPDMADNSYTAYDPVFWSYHANIDRMFEIWLRAHPEVRYTAGFALHPFSGPQATRFEFTDRRGFVYTTIGDLARDSRGLGYDFAAPLDPDFGGIATLADQGGASPGACPHASAAKAAPAAAQVPASELLVVFDGVRCTHDSYAIDVFLGVDAPEPEDVSAANPHYVGRLSRIGMGQEDTRGRCIRVGVPRILDATGTAEALGLKEGELPSWSIIVTALADGRVLSGADYDALPGFVPRLVWSAGGRVSVQGAASSGSSSCCCAQPS